MFAVPEGFWAEQGGWAPEVHEYKGKFYLLTTLHNEKKPLVQEGRPVGHPTYMRGTIIAVSDGPEGPFVPVSDGPIPPANFMTLDGTLYVDRAGKPWMVYAHEWLQATDGKMEAVPLKDDLTDASGPPISLFKASDAPWLDAQAVPNARGSVYVTDGPELFRSKDGHLLMLWSSYENLSDNDGDSHYVETIARSQSGEIKGPWVQLEPLVKQDLLALPLREAREQFERAYLQQQLLLCNGKVGQLAKRVGMERTHLYRKLRALGVDFRQLGED